MAHINELVLEITRRCNIQCRHCLRGEAQSKNMSFETIRKALVGISSIGTVTFTGGEPCLAVDRIRYFTEYIRNWHISLGAFYVVTNGKVASRSLADALTKLSWWCDEPDGGGLIMSQDQYHRELGYNQWPANELYETLPFYLPEGRGNIEAPINEGLAFENGIGLRSANVNHPVITDDYEGNKTFVEGTVYVNANGDVIPCCGISYESQELEKIGSVYDRPLFEIIKQHADSLEEVAV